MNKEHMEAMREMAENPNELNQATAEKDVVSDSFTRLYESELQIARKKGDTTRVQYLESLRGMVAGAENGREMAENPNELNQATAEKDVVSDSFTRLYESELQAAREKGDTTRVQYLESLRGKVAGTENGNHAGEISFGNSVDDALKANHAKLAAEYTKKIQDAQRDIKRAKEHLESDSRANRDTTTSRNELKAAIERQKSAKDWYEHHKIRS